MHIDARSWLDTFLEGTEATTEDLEKIRQLKEGQHLEFKDGVITRKSNRKAGIQEIREAISGFANAEGGLLIVGVHDGTKEISPCTSLGTEPLAKWAESVVRDLIPYFSPLPRFQEVPYPNGEVLVVAVPRSPRLIPCVGRRESHYFLRVHESTVEVPGYLLSDLLLGRRQQPSVRMQPRVTVGTSPSLDPVLGIYFEVENDSLIDIEESRVGVVIWASRTQADPISHHLRTYVDDLAPESPSLRFGERNDWDLVHLESEAYPSSSRGSKISPFSSCNFRIERLGIAFEGIYHCGVYVLPKSSMPIWFQLKFTVEKNLEDGRLLVEEQSVSCQAVGRPLVDWKRKDP